MCAAIHNERKPRSMAERLLLLAGRLTDRDRAIIRLLFEHRLFITHQLAQVFFDSHDRAEHRLKQLTDAKVLARFRPHTRRGEGSAPYHYLLGPAGAAVLAAEHNTDLRRLGYRADKALQLAHSQRLAHLVGVNGFFTALLGHARHVPPGRARLAVWWSERECNDRWGHIVRPDGYGRWQEASREVDFFLEYDRGSEPLDRLAAKLAGYGELADATQIGTPVLLWLPSAGREASVRQALAREGRWSRLRFVVATASPTLGLGPAEAAWLPLGRPGPDAASSTWPTPTPGTLSLPGRSRDGTKQRRGYRRAHPRHRRAHRPRPGPRPRSPRPGRPAYGSGADPRCQARRQ
jgi:Replication-relaxation